MTGIESKSVARFARDFAVRHDGGDVSSFVVASDELVEGVTEDVSSALAYFASGRSVASLLATTSRGLLARLREPHEILIAGIVRWPVNEWQVLDFHRDRVIGHSLVLVMSEASVEIMVAYAPHLYSFVSQPVREAIDEALLTDEERRQRITALEASKGFSSSELVARAQSGESFADSEYGEWLLLLGRGDLL